MRPYLARRRKRFFHIELSDFEAGMAERREASDFYLDAMDARAKGKNLRAVPIRKAATIKKLDWGLH
jgi:hypothetical protein